MTKYYDRYIDEKIEKALRTSGALLVAGPRFCGKTTTCMRYQRSFVKLNTSQSIQIASMNPSLVLKGDKPRLIDEWQKVPDIWNQVKNDLDEEYVFGKYILTGSSTPADKTQVHHSGAGRITPIRMRPMSLFESKDSQGKVSLSELFRGGDPEMFEENKDFTLLEVAYLLCRGGWPISVISPKDIAVEITRNYYSNLFLFEDSDNEKFRNLKPETFRMILRSYARNISSESSLKTIMEDVRQSNERAMDPKTFSNYLEALKDLFIIEDMDAWNPNIRSKTSIRVTPTRHFVDPSLACRALNIGPEDLLSDLRSFGLFFEDMAVRDLRIYADMIGGEIRHYRDNAGLECDSVIHLENGKWAAVEIKLGGEKLVEEGARSLNNLKKKIETKSDYPSPVFLMVLTATGPLYRRDDGIYVVPINMLKA
ncbi:MAG: ATP-binding protein [Spirochaetales bacterium]|nr:ATP-binding protein [Spirochaetales bacterium]